MPGRLEGKVAIVTGGASGFGRGIAQKFVEEGAKVIIADLSLEDGQKAAQELSCVFEQANVTRRDDWAFLLKRALDSYGQLDVVVNNAGATYVNKPTTQVSDEDFDLVMQVNVKSLYLSTSVLLPYFLDNDRTGSFVQVSSTAALRPRPGLTWYNASKAAVSNATKTMAVEFGPKGIRFNAVCPVVGSTGMYEKSVFAPVTNFFVVKLTFSQDTSLPGSTEYGRESRSVCVDGAAGTGQYTGGCGQCGLLSGE
jgi:NAD(P)-dependent dehydrogenase (short-subunit alcohol dehydrogenase family)